MKNVIPKFLLFVIMMTAAAAAADSSISSISSTLATKLAIEEEKLLLDNEEIEEANTTTTPDVIVVVESAHDINIHIYTSAMAIAEYDSGCRTNTIHRNDNYNFSPRNRDGQGCKPK